MPAFEGGAAQPVTVDTSGPVEGRAAIPVYVASGGPQLPGPGRRVVVVTDGPVEGRAAIPVYEVAAGGPLIDAPAVPVFVVQGGLGASSPAGPSSLLTGLISYWKLEEASGTRVDSVVTSGNDLTDNNTVTQASGKVGNAAQFTAANSESLSRASNALLQTGDIDFTLPAWVYLDAKAARRPILSKWDTANNREYILQYDSTPDRFSVQVSSNGSATTTLNANTLGSPSTATWYFIVVWHDSANDTLNIQVNDGGIDSQAYASGVFAGTSDFKVATGAGFFLGGRIDEVGFWKRTLTAAERATLYNSGAGRTYPFTGT